MNKKSLIRWWRRLPAETKLRIAQRAHTSVAYLSQVIYGHRKMTVEMAAKIEQAWAPGADTPTRKELCETCAKCPFQGL